MDHESNWRVEEHAGQFVEQVLNGRQYTQLYRACHGGVTFRSPSEVSIGADQVYAALREMCAAFPDGVFRIEYCMSHAERVIMRMTWQGTHKRDWKGLRATQRRISLTMMWVFTFQAERVKDIEVLFDAQTLLSQLGGQGVHLR